MSKKIYGVKPPSYDDAIRRAAARITTVNTRVTQLVKTITDKPDPATKQETLERLTLLKEELTTLLRL